MTTWAIDLDGVVWRGSRLLPGADDAVARLLDAGVAVVFCTNHAHSPEVKERKLEALGVPSAPVITSAEAAAAACGAGSKVLVLGDPSLVECMAGYGLRAQDVWDLPDADVPEFDAVVVGGTSRWDRARVGMIADAVRAGSRFLATNDDPTYPVAGVDGPRLLPGNGALVAAVQTASGRLAEVAGKPHAVMADLLVQRYGPIDVVVGDKPETDGALAERLEARFALVLSGVTASEDLPVEPSPVVIGADLSDAVDQLLAATE